MTELMEPTFIKDYGIGITQGESFSINFGVKPLSDQSVNYLEDTTLYSALMKIRQGDPAGDLVLDASSYVFLGFTPPNSVRNTVYGIGQKVVPSALNGYVYECVIPGTSHASTEPTWPLVLGNTVTDGTVTWRCETTDADGRVANVHIEIPRIVTAALTDWGRGVWALSVRNPFGESFFYVDGPCYLRKSSVN